MRGQRIATQDYLAGIAEQVGFVVVVYLRGHWTGTGG